MAFVSAVFSCIPCLLIFDASALHLAGAQPAPNLLVLSAMHGSKIQDSLSSIGLIVSSPHNCAQQGYRLPDPFQRQREPGPG